MSYPLAGASQSTSAATPRSKRPPTASRAGENHRIRARICASEEAARQSAVDRDDRPRDVVRRIGGEEAGDLRDLARLAEAAERDRLDVFGARLALERLGEPGGLDPAW